MCICKKDALMVSPHVEHLRKSLSIVDSLRLMKKSSFQHACLLFFSPIMNYQVCCGLCKYCTCGRSIIKNVPAILPLTDYGTLILVQIYVIIADITENTLLNNTLFNPHFGNALYITK